VDRNEIRCRTCDRILHSKTSRERLLCQLCDTGKHGPKSRAGVHTLGKTWRLKKYLEPDEPPARSEPVVQHSERPPRVGGRGG
jgi:hypothetical protein